MERPVLRWSDRVASQRLALMLTVAVLLSGCLGGLQPPGFQGFGRGQAADDPQQARLFAAEGSTAAFPVMDDLRARRSVLPAGGSYAAVAQAVILASGGASAAAITSASFTEPPG